MWTEKSTYKKYRKLIILMGMGRLVQKTRAGLPLDSDALPKQRNPRQQGLFAIWIKKLVYG